MKQDDFDAIEVNGTKTKLGLFPAVVNDPTAENILDSRVDVYFLELRMLVLLNHLSMRILH